LPCLFPLLGCHFLTSFVRRSLLKWLKRGQSETWWHRHGIANRFRLGARVEHRQIPFDVLIDSNVRRLLCASDFRCPCTAARLARKGLITIAKRAELLGYESLWVWDRLLAPVNPKAPYPLGDGTHPPQFRSVLDPLEALAFTAGHTEHIALGTSVFILSLTIPPSSRGSSRR
jgi:Luciferase-like monooxygenase